jgi:hypothetical protein
MKILFFILMYGCMFFTTLQAQNITGIWRGTFNYAYNALALDDNNTYKYEVQIDASGNNLDGVTYSYLNTSFYGKASLEGKYNRASKQYIIKETKILEVVSMSGSACLMTCYLTYSKSGNDEYLTGYYKGCGGGPVSLKKVQTSYFKKEPFLEKKNTAKPPIIVKDTIKKVPPAPPIDTKPVPPIIVKDTVKKAPPPTILERKNDIVETIPINAETIKINFYDNGTLDGDSISVYVNGKLMLKNQRLSYDPIVLELKKAELNDVNDIVMVAENLGSIPPNTATMIVYVGKTRYEISLESTNQKNATVRFKK